MNTPDATLQPSARTVPGLIGQTGASPPDSSGSGGGEPSRAPSFAVPPEPAGVHLAAVVHMDMVGYSRLMHLDEAGTFARLRAVHDVLTAPMAAHAGGRVVDTAGDSALVTFGSAVGAVRYALGFQEALASREAEEPIDRTIRFRIGVTVADVLADGAGVHGNGVNVAARLQAACPPGAVCISRAVCDQVRHKVDAEFKPLGSLALKNIAQPVEAFVVRPRQEGHGRRLARWPRGVVRSHRDRRAGPWAALATAALVVGTGVAGWVASTRAPPAPPPMSAVAAAPDLGIRNAPRLSLVVLPFANSSPDAGQDYLADAVTDDLTTDLARLDGAFVIGRGSALTYRGRALGARQVGGELGVRYVVQGSVRRVDPATVRVNAELVSAETGEGLWADRFDQDVRDVGQGQGEIVRRLAIALGARLLDTEAQRSLRDRPDNPDAFDLVLRARSLQSRGIDRTRAAEAEALYERALQLDPNSVPALAGLASRLYGNNHLLHEGKPGDLRRAERLLATAEALRPTSLTVVMLRATVRIWQNRCDEAIEAYRQVIDSDPNAWLSFSQIAICRMRRGELEASLDLLRESIRRNPRDSYVWIRYGLVGEVLLRQRHPADAIPWLKRALDGNAARDERSSQQNRLCLVSALGHVGQLDAARRELAVLSRLTPFLTARGLDNRSERFSPAQAAQKQYVADGLRRAGLRDHADEDAADAGASGGGELHQEAFGLTPTSAPGASVIRTADVQRLLAEGGAPPLPLVLDLNATGRSLPGAVVLGESFTGGSFDDDRQDRLGRLMRQLTAGDTARPIVVLGWNAERWGSRNLVLRLVTLGYTRVHWYRGGKESWEAYGLPEVEVDKIEW